MEWQPLDSAKQEQRFEMSLQILIGALACRVGVFKKVISRNSLNHSCNNAVTDVTTERASGDTVTIDMRIF